MKTSSKRELTPKQAEAPAAKPVPVKKLARVKAVRKAPQADIQSQVEAAERMVRQKEMVSEVGLYDVLREIKGIRTMLVKEREPAATADAALEREVDSLRRVLSGLMERRMESFMSKLIHLRTSAAEGGRNVASRIDELLVDLGALRFEAEPMDYFDPLIHTIVEERHVAEAPDGVILETVREGYRTGGGTILAKAHVAVNSRRA